MKDSDDDGVINDDDDDDDDDDDGENDFNPLESLSFESFEQ